MSKEKYKEYDERAIEAILNCMEESASNMRLSGDDETAKANAVAMKLLTNAYLDITRG